MKVLDETSLLQVACDTNHVNALLGNGNSLDPAFRGLRIRTAQINRHKVGKRCLVHYSAIDSCGSPVEFLGKIRFKGLDRKSAAIQQSLYASNFDGAHGFSVPRVYGSLPSLNMWLQEFVVHADALSAQSVNFVAVQPRVAQALSRLHRTSVVGLRQHTVDDELALLHYRFQQLGQTHPELRSLVDSLETTTATIADELRSNPLQTIIHRDFYFDQILLSDSQTFLVDLDLCCLGPPELDVGNYVGHLREYGIRCPEFAKICQAAEEAFLPAYVEHLPQTSRKAVECWATLTLARHVSLSTLLPGRSHTTLALAATTIGN